MKRGAKDLLDCRSDFPALQSSHLFFDGPGGTQVPQSVIDRMVEYLTRENANLHGLFQTSQATDRVLDLARLRMAQFLGAKPEEIAFGANMTTLNFSLARAIARDLQAKDEIIITQLDHEANREPWISLEEEGIVIREVAVDRETCTLDMEDLESKINEKTRVIAFTYASNAVGTITAAKEIIQLAKKVHAMTVVDAVHAAPHIPIHVKDLGCTYLLCSVYKFFGPHVGILYGEKDSFQRLKALRVRPQRGEAPYKIESGTLNHEGIAGTAAAVEYLASLGEPFLQKYPSKEDSQEREKLYAAMQAIYHYEEELFQELQEGLERVEGLRIYGPPRESPRTPTLAFTLKEKTPKEIARELGREGIYVWFGDFYATTLLECLGLKETGVVRVGLAPYNTRKDVSQLIEAIERIDTSL